MTTDHDHEVAMALYDVAERAGIVYDDLDAAWDAIRWPHFIQRRRAFREREEAWQFYRQALKDAGI